MGLEKLYLSFCVLGLFSGLGVMVPGWGLVSGLHVDLLQEFHLQTSAGVLQVPGRHDNSHAFLFQDAWRDVRAGRGVAERIVARLGQRSEVSLLVTLKQETQNSGVLLSIHHDQQRYLEVESSGPRREVRVRYRSAGQRGSITETFRYHLGDGQWHRLALALSPALLVLHVDCHRVYERRVENLSLDFPPDSSVWLGQRNKNHGYFQGMMQDVQLMLEPQGYLSQCPDLNNTCPTCKDFHGLVQKIMELQDVLAKTSSKLALAEEKVRGVEACRCERGCGLNGVRYQEGDGWTDGCTTCSCWNGTVQCDPVSCPPPSCPPDSAPAFVPGACCKECQPVCVFRGRVYVEGDRKSVRDFLGNCLLFQCQARSMRRVEEVVCPELSCPESEQISLTDRCCQVCPGHDFCAEQSVCVENSECVNLEAGACCSCRDGFRALRDDSAYCHDVDECSEGRHYCRENTRCVNTPGSFLCHCLPGYLRIDDYSCTEQDECEGLHGCDRDAICSNTVGGHRCTCKPGYHGNGTVCTALCDGPCQHGGSCVERDTCVCQQGYTGRSCETDIDECVEGFVECDSRASCVNLPGWFHCECRQGYHDNGLFSANGDSCEDIDECVSARHGCANDTVCVNLDGGFDCHCPRGNNCSGDCHHDDKVKHNGQIWTLDDDRCVVCSCQVAMVMCRRMVCDCDSAAADWFCCPECDAQLGSRCLRLDGQISYSAGDTWQEGCQQCQCMGGQVDCWPLSCPAFGGCEGGSQIPEGGCCPRCLSDPCQGDAHNDITSSCVDESGVTRYGGSTWTRHASECDRCTCKNGHVCCSVDPLCL